ncbi:MAG: DUF4131 domain-containing protein, partial [Candidatus Omnitrophota bacterium]
MKRPLVALTAIFCLGIALAGKVRISFSLAYSLTIVLLILSILWVKKGTKFDLLLSFLALCLGVTLSLEHKTLPRNHISFLAPYYCKNKDCLVKGVVDSQPKSKNNRMFFLFKLEEVQYEGMRYKTCGNILAYVKGS